MQKPVKRILVVSAHAADWCTRAGGTILRYLEQGAEVTVFALTYGERGESGEYWAANPAGPVEACKECRRREALAAARLMGVSIEFFDYNDYPLVLSARQLRDLTRRILELRPDVILTHFFSDPLNVDHEVTSSAVIRAVSGAAMLGALPATPAHFVPDVFLFESSLPHSEFNGFKIDTYVDVTGVFGQKLAAVAKFEAQPHLVDYYRRCGERRGEQATNWLRGRGTVRYAEGFLRYTPFVGSLPPATQWG
ncbi:PIG-L deacetylase family protein [Allofournierella sp.]|uniref:PIG-L deacetylase family protein n=1 Tax=Allofournierella sp. TaxID=1940256 RepID=UPI003AB3AEBF